MTARRSRRSGLYRLWRRFLLRIRPQVEQLAHHVNHRGGLRIARRRFQRRDRRVHDLVDDALGQRFDRQFLLRRQLAQAAAHAIQLGLPQGLKMLLQTDDGRHHLGGLGARLKLAHLFVHQGLSAYGLFAPVAQVRLHHLLQIVDVVNKDAVQVIQPGINVARHRNVDEEHRAVLACLQKLFAMLFAEDGMWRARRADDDVGPGNRVI